MIDPTRLLGGLLLGGALKRGGLGRGLGGAGKMALGMGALGVAIAAFEHFMQQRQQQGAAPTPRAGVPGIPGGPSGSMPPPLPPVGSPGSAASPAAATTGLTQQQREALLLIRGMISAAYADGALDAQERNAILARLGETGLAAEDHAFLGSELLSPPPLESLLQQVDRPELAEAFYAASLLAIRVDTPAETQYLEFLAARLGLNQETTARLHALAKEI